MRKNLSAFKSRPRQYYIAREGFPFAAISLAATVLVWILTGIYFALPFFGITVFVLFFFRNPERCIPKDEGAIISPADGKIIEIREVSAPYTNERAIKISIFMSVFNVHINRMPVNSKVEKIFYHPGKFFVASLEKASEHNERNGVVLSIDGGKKIVLVQIAGLVARRIVCYLKEEDVLKKGDRIGLIRFGSRVDIYLPTDVKIESKVGDKVTAGETVVARL